jgi:hypothetical protein
MTIQMMTDSFMENIISEASKNIYLTFIIYLSNKMEDRPYQFCLWNVEKYYSELLVFGLYFLEYQTMDKVQKPSNSKCYTPLSEPLEYICTTGMDTVQIFPLGNYNA